jgi:integrase
MDDFWSKSKPATRTELDRDTVMINGVPFSKEFLAELIAEKIEHPTKAPSRVSTALSLYLREHPNAHRKRFKATAELYCRYFISSMGDLLLEDLKHHHITQYRDLQLERGLAPASVRKHCNTLNAIINMAFKHMDIDRLSPFRGVKIRGEHDIEQSIPPITLDKLQAVKEQLLIGPSAYRLVALIQLNTGMRVSEPALARLEDCVLDHEIPHLWVRRNEITDRKTRNSIRAVPLVGASLAAATRLVERSRAANSAWLVPEYAHEFGNASCSAAINKGLKPLAFRSHMFRHAFIDRLKGCNDIPTKLAESITGHRSGGSEFDTYGSVGYTLEQKLEVIKRVEV